MNLQSAVSQMLSFFFNVEGNGIYLDYISLIATLAIFAGLVMLLLCAFGADKRSCKTILFIMAIGVTVLFVGNFIFESVVSNGLVSETVPVIMEG